MQEKKTKKLEIIEIKKTYYVCPICGYSNENRSFANQCMGMPIEKINFKIDDIVKFKFKYRKRWPRKPKPILCRVTDIQGPKRDFLNFSHTYLIAVEPIDPKNAKFASKFIYYRQDHFELVKRPEKKEKKEKQKMGISSSCETPSHLIHNEDDVKRNTALFDQLCEQTNRIVLPVAREALKREKADSKTVIEENEVIKETRGITQVIMSEWIDILYDLLSRNPSSLLTLTDELLPEVDVIPIEPELEKPPREALQVIISPFAINVEDAENIFKKLRGEFFKDSDKVELPLGIILELDRSINVVVARLTQC